MANRLEPEHLSPELRIDAELELAVAKNMKFIANIMRMEPFGPQNPKPLFVTRRLQDGGRSAVLKGEHLRLDALDEHGNYIQGIGFFMKEHFDLVSSGAAFDVCYQVGINSWKGRESVQLILKDLRKSD